MLNKLSNGSGGKNILLLQGPVGPFFCRLHEHLTRHGLNVYRAVFHVGDYFFSRPKQRVICYEGAAQWRQWLTEKLETKQIDVIIYYGSERPAHKIARELGLKYGVELISLEEGYIRTGLITIENIANNANSPLAGMMPDDDYQPSANANKLFSTKNNMFLITIYGTLYFNFRGWFVTSAQRELFHREIPLVHEGTRWIRNFYLKKTKRRENRLAVETLINQWHKKYYIVPLQVASDVNMRDAAMGWDSPRLIEQSIISFARSAPADTRLVFKVHPMERGHSEIGPLVNSIAEKYGVGERVVVLDDGALADLTRHAAGMITINSSSGFSALFHGVPLMVIGKAVFACAAIAICANGNPEFDDFWNTKHVAEEKLRKLYILWLKDQALRPGDFYSRQGMKIACKSIYEKLEL